jgi:hypothetical protein
MIQFTHVFFVQYLLITINLQPNPSSLTAEDSLHSHSRSTTVFSFTVTDFLLIYESITYFTNEESHMTSHLRLTRTTTAFWLNYLPSESWLTQSQSYFTTGDLSPISSSWRQAPWESRPVFFFQLNTSFHSPYVTSSLTTFTVAAESRQRSHSQVQVLRDSWPHFSVSDSRLPQPGGPGPRIYITRE